MPKKDLWGASKMPQDMYLKMEVKDEGKMRAKIWCPVKVGLVCFFLWMLSPRGSGAGRRKGEVSRMSGGASLWR